MKAKFARLLRSGVLCVICLVPAGAMAQAGPARMLTAVNAFFGTLSPSQKQKLSFAYDDQEQRMRWSNLPTTMVPRAGLNLGSLSATQRNAAMVLVATALSARGYKKVQEIMGGDEVLKSQGGGRGGAPMFGQDLYYISVLGTPSASTPWMLQFGGHHLALNITVAGDKGVLTPTLTAAQPGLYTLNGKSVRPLGAESDKAAALFNSLDAQQRSQAVLSSRVADLVLGPGQDGKTIQPEGLKATAMTEPQRTMLMGLISEWSGIIYDDAAATRLAEVKAGLNDTWFAWSGPATANVGSNIESYYRVQGPNLVIEYAPQRGDPAMHIHTMYRDPTNDYGRRLAAR